MDLPIFNKHATFYILHYFWLKKLMRNRYRINNRERKISLFRRKSDILHENTVGTRMFIITSRNGTNHNYYLKVKFVVFSTFYDVRNSRSMRDRASGCITLSKIRKLKTFIFPRREHKKKRSQHTNNRTANFF